jgi:tetratricopeptide (TPR) repeat protein/predicted aspartyl protease
MTGKFVVLAVSAVALAAIGSPALADCKLEKVAEMPVIMQNARPTVSARVNGQDATFVVASGDFYSMVSKDAAARFGMKASMAPYGLRVTSIGGDDGPAKVAKAKDFTFLGMSFPNQEFLVSPRNGPIAAGAIGQNILGALDIEYDLANGVVRFFKTEGCGASNLAYWSQGKTVSRISIDSPSQGLTEVIGTAKIDGRVVHVKFSSGTAFSYLSKPAAARAGIRPSSDGVVAGGITYSLYGKGLETSVAPFESFAIGDEEIKNIRLRVADIDLKDADMLLGTDFFLSHRILVSKSQHKLYFTYNGGPVFRLDRPAGAQQANAAPSPAASEPAAGPGPAEGASTTAADFSREGAALAARRDFPAAIADFTKAIELEPKDGGHYRDRALARLGNREPMLAMADLDEGLKLKPDDVQALMTRGELLIQRRDLARAQADFDAAIRLAPENHNLPLRAGAAYTRSGAFEQGVREYDNWLAAHPKDDDAAKVLNARCFTRAAWGKELETALADCDAAVKRGGKISTVLDNRGLVLLRLGRVDEAIKQYDAAIRAQPKAAWALYGRGLAKLKKGEKAEGDADIQAATAIAPNLPQEAKRYGLAAEDAPAAAKS